MRTVVLTFDNLGEAAALERGEHPTGDHPSVTEALPRLLEALGAHGLRATFFVEAINAERYPEALRAIAAAGHELGMHAWRHESWGELELDREAALLQRGLAAYADLGLEITAFRPPGGGLTERTLERLGAAGLAWCSPEGERAYVAAEGPVVLPFRWPLVDATYLLGPFAALRGRIGLAAAPLGPGEAGARLRAELGSETDPAAAVLILHPFLALDPGVWAMHRELLAWLAGQRDAGTLRVVPGGVVAAGLAGLAPGR